MDESAAAFFDLDRTLISGSSVFAFGMAAWRHGMVTTGELISDGVNAILFRFGGSTDEKANAVRDRILEAIKGRSVSELEQLGDEVISQLLDAVRRESQALIDLHHEAGRETFIVSASPVEIVQAFSEAVGLTGGIGTVSEIVDGTYTGRLSEPFCYGKGKATAIAKLASERGYDLRLCYAYSDSISDLPMLELVGHPVAVNPDRSLESIAFQRGWPIIEFSKTAKRVIGTTTAIAGAAGVATATYFLGLSHGRGSR
jgi:HAD superfamily hydrolase (TIGR01490 family)